jgi:hypothetical protein
MNAPLQIYSYGAYSHAVDDALPDLKTAVQQACGKSFRRIGRFIQLALIGAARCRGIHMLPDDTAVYLSSARGDLELTLEIMTSLFRDGQTPKPLAFVNTVSNAACFYVAQLLELQSRSNFVCNPTLAFESALQLAMLDVQTGRTASALVGSTDIATTPLAEHRQRVQVPPDTIMGEGSHWLWLGSRNSASPLLGELHTAQHFTDREQLFAWLDAQAFDRENCAFAAGQWLSDADHDAIRSHARISSEFNYRATLPHYGSHSGAALGAFLTSAHPSQWLLHVNSDGGQRYSAMLVKRAKAA